MSRRWTIPLVALLGCTWLVPAAWSQSPLVERFQELRRGWGGSSDSTAEPRATAPARTPSPTPRTVAAPDRPGFLPQIDARSLFPTNLFGRATNDESDDPAPTTDQPRAGSARLADLPTEPPRTAEQSQAAPSPVARRAVGTPSADSFTLPGLSRPDAAISRSANPSAKPSPDTTLSRVLEAGNPPPRMASRQPVELPAAPKPRTETEPRTAASSSAESIRRSPTRHTVVDFDPEELRNELAGSFPVGGNDKQAANEPDEGTFASESKSPTLATEPDESEPKTVRRVTDLPKIGTAKQSTIASPTARLSSLPAKRDAEESDAESQPTPQIAPVWTDVSPSALSASSEVPTDSDEPVNELRGPRTTTINRAGESTVANQTDRTIRAAETNRAAAEAFGAPAATATVEPRVEIAPARQMYDTDLADTATPADAPTRAQPASAVLVANQAPVITADIRGPKQIVVGREVTYLVRLENHGTVAAEQLDANVAIPSWAEIIDTTATRGVVRHSEATELNSSLEWRLPRLESGTSQTLHVRLIPRGSRPLELGVSWTHAPVASRAVVEVQEPKLQMHVAGPDDVLYGKPYVYRLNLSNPGTGVAEDVRIDLMPLGGGGRPVGTQRIGDLAPGASKSVEVELTAREAGKLSVEAIATAAGGLRAEASRELFCRKPELEVDWRGPEMQYSGTTATYFVRVRNPGTASADDVAVRVALPPGAKFVSASEGHAHDGARGEVAWRVGSLGPGDDCYMELRCEMQTAGENRLQITAATAAGDLSDVKVATTDVVALADLTLGVSDPSGPVLVGDDATYEIRIENRGASAAEEVNVVALFSAGLEPQTVEGGSYSVADGRVTFRTLRKLPAGQQTVLRIRARATQSGTHVFRAEVLCNDLEIKLAAEETTRFYENQFVHEDRSAAPTSVGGRYGESYR